MEQTSGRTIAARWILPVSTPPILGGWLRLVGGRVVEIGRGPPPHGAEDFGDVALLPGLVNAHTHLEFSDLEQPIGRPGTPLHHWIGQVIAARGTTDERRKHAAITRGLAESKAAGVRLLGEITTPPCNYVLPDESIDLVSFAEVIGLSPQRWQERFAAALKHQGRDEHQGRAEHRGKIERTGWSPHAPYSTQRGAIAQCLEHAARVGSPVAMHVAESPAERELLEQGTGPFADALRELGVWREGLFPWPREPVASLIDQLARAPQALLVHGNDLCEAEIERIRGHVNLTVVYCPRTHARFGNPPHPIARLLAAGVRVALGTDSRASNPDLNLWGEVQWLLRHRTDLDPSRVLEMATLAGAEALGRRDVGRIEPGGQPGLCFLETEANEVAGLWEDCARRRLRPA